MREIKFRGFYKVSKQVVYRGLFDRNWYSEPKGGKCVNAIHPNDKNTMIIQQYTGLKDVIGSCIYEGSNVSDGEFIYIVTWDIEMAQYYIDPVKCIKDDEYPLFLVPYTLLGNALKLTVIGNIHNTEK